jgi:nickel transport system permease protein
MGTYILKRLGFALPLFVLISFISFALLNLSSKDAAVSVINASGIYRMSEELLVKTRAELGLDKPFIERYWVWLKNCASLDFGDSYVYKKPVREVILPGFINTFQLALAGIGVIIPVSLILGILCAKFEQGLFDRIIRFLIFLLNAMPAYWIGTLLIWGIAVKLNLLPTSGKEGAAGFVLPVMVLSLSHFSYYMRLIRSELLRHSHEDYIRYGRALGLKEWILLRHSLKNSLQTALSAFFLGIPGLLAGTVVVENVFAWPGVGRLCVTAIFSQDIPVMQAYILILAVCFVGFNLFADVLNAAINPRLREA